MAEPLLDELADAVLEGAVVDWAAVESSAGAADQPLVRNLKLMASVAKVHRDILPAVAPDVRGQWGHLRLLESVGRGACGEVFRAWDTRLDREVALKLLPAAPSDQDDSVASALAGLLGDPRSIIHEGRLLAKVRHPNVVTIHGAEQIGDRIGLWMEFIHGRTLEQLLQHGAVFQTAEVVAIGAELCRAVAAVHAAGLLHRDIKTHNVMRAADGRVVLMDFDVGREFDNASPPDVAGTPLYLAPELFRGQPATVQSDVYSVGVVLYRLVTGSYPVRGGSIRELREAHKRGERVAVRDAQPNVGSGLARVIDQAIDPAPERRPESAAALAGRLVELQRRERLKPVLYAAALVTALAAVGVLAWALRTPSEPLVPPGPVAPAQATPAGDPAPTAPPPPPVGSPSSPPASITPARGKTPAVAALSAVARGQQIGVRPSVQVLALTNGSARAEDAWLSSALAEMILREFRGSEQFRWIPGAVPLAKAQLGQALITEGSISVRPVTPADVVISGEFRTSGPEGALALTLTIRDMWNDRGATSVTETGTVGDLVALIARLGVKARAALGAPALTGDQTRALIASQPANAASARAYAEGLTKLASEWVEAMEEAVRADPRFAPAYAALAEGWLFRRDPDRAKAAAARALETAATLPREERMLIEVRAWVVTSGGNASVEAREGIFRQLYKLFPDTLHYAFETARAHQRVRQHAASLAVVDAVSRLPGASEHVGLLQLEQRAARQLKDVARAQRAGDKLAAIATAVGDSTLLHSVRQDEALLALEMGDHVGALAKAEESGRLRLAIVNSTQIANAQSTADSIIRSQGGFVWAMPTYRQLIASAKQQGHYAQYGYLVQRLAALLADHGDLLEARAQWELLNEDPMTRDLPGTVSALLGFGGVLLRQGDVGTAQRTMETALALAVERKDPSATAAAHLALAGLLMERGDIGGAREQADRALALPQQTPPNLDDLAAAQIVQGRVRREAGEDGPASQAVQEAASIKKTSMQYGRGARLGIDLAMLQAQIAQDDGRPGEARSFAQRAADLARSNGWPDLEAAAGSLLALAWLAEGRLAEAQQIVTAVSQRLKATEDRLLHFTGGLAVGRVQAASVGAPASITLGLQRLEVSSRQAAALGAVAIALELRLALGEAEIAAGEVAAGRTRLAVLERDATARGFVRIATRAAAARR